MASQTLGKPRVLEHCQRLDPTHLGATSAVLRRRSTRRRSDGVRRQAPRHLSRRRRAAASRRRRSHTAGGISAPSSSSSSITPAIGCAPGLHMCDLPLQPVRGRPGIGVSGGDQAERPPGVQQTRAGGIHPGAPRPPAPLPGPSMVVTPRSQPRRGTRSGRPRRWRHGRHRARHRLESVHGQRLRGQGSQAALDALLLVTGGTRRPLLPTGPLGDEPHAAFVLSSASWVSTPTICPSRPYHATKPPSGPGSNRAGVITVSPGGVLEGPAPDRRPEARDGIPLRRPPAALRPAISPCARASPQCSTRRLRPAVLLTPCRRRRRRTAPGIAARIPVSTGIAPSSSSSPIPRPARSVARHPPPSPPDSRRHASRPRPPRSRRLSLDRVDRVPELQRTPSHVAICDLGSSLRPQPCSFGVASSEISVTSTRDDEATPRSRSR